MSKEKNFLENDFVSYKNEKIVFCQDGRIFSIDKDTELVNLRDCENCKQKDQRIAELEKENEQLKAKLEIWNRFNKEDYIHKGEKATERDYYYYTNGASSVLENEVEQLKANQNKVAIEKLGEILSFIYGNKWTNIELCVDNSPLKIIRNKLDTMLTELKGDK